MKVKDAMSPHLVTVKADDVAIDALKILVRKGVSGAPVIGEGGQLVGLVTEFDLLLALDFVGEGVPVSKIMSSNVVTVEPDTDLEEVRDLLLVNNFRRIPVAKEGKIIGIISRRDILRVHLGIEEE
ncbi:MAG: CBS domain-containing protein [Pseudomonadota bacterium]